VLKLLDLFSGIGGFSLGLESTGGFKTIAFVEKDEFCQKVLKKHWPNITIEGDIRNVKGEKYEADVITGGFPCQPFSVAGKRRGTNDDRYLWDETIRVIRECKPRWFIGENVEGLININNGVVLRQVQTDLEKEGFEVQCLVIPAAGIGAWHQRKRIWIIGHSKHNGFIASKIKGGDRKINERSSQGKNETSEFKRASRRENNETVWMAADAQISRTRENERGIWEGSRGINGGQGTNQNVSNSNSRFSIGENKEIQTRGTSINNGSENVSNSNNTGDRTSKYNFKKQETIDKERKKFSQSKFSRHSEDVSNSISSGSRRGRISRNVNEQGWNTFETERESLQSKNKQTRSNDIKQNSEDVSNSKSIRYRGRESEECQIGEWSFLQGKQEGGKMGSEVKGCNGNVSNSNDKGLERYNGNSSSIKTGEEQTNSWSKNCSQQFREQKKGKIGSETLPNSNNERLQRLDSESIIQEQKLGLFTNKDDEGRETWWQTQSRICGVPNGVSYELDKDRTNRIKALGNSIVPQIARKLGLAILEAEK